VTLRSVKLAVTVTLVPALPTGTGPLGGPVGGATTGGALPGQIPPTHAGFAAPGVHVPAWQLSLTVQMFVSLQELPSGLFGLEHTPELGSQVPASWH